ncbi:MAG: hypothetical protein ACJ8R9_17855 [Steroidobacteraceae bacterium]
MDEHIRAAIGTYGEYLDGKVDRMNEAIVEAIRAIRTYAYERNPDDLDIQQKIVTAKRKGLSGTDLESLLLELG